MTTSHSSFDRTHSDREALSALFDGELVGDAARFALKRLDHDHDWRETCERWTVVGDVLRGQGSVLLPAGFPSRVRAAMAAEPSSRHVVATRPRWTAWSGVGLAASAAAVALFFAGQNALEAPETSPAVIVATPTPAEPENAAAPSLPDQTTRTVAQLATAGIVVAGASRQAAQRTRDAQRNRTPAPRAVAAAPAGAGKNAAAESAMERIAAEPSAIARHTIDRTSVERSAVQQPAVQQPTFQQFAVQQPAIESRADTVVAASAPVQSPVLPASADPFAGDAARPWPRAVLPQYGGNGALTTEFGSRPSPSFYPFEPRLPGDEGDGEPPASTPTSP